MICPYCDHENIAGVEECENCDHDLTAHDQPAAGSELEASVMEAHLTRLGPRPPIIVPPTTTVAQVIEQLCTNHIGCVLVGTPDDLEGIFSERDVLLRIADRYDEVADRPVSEFMTPSPEQLDIEAPIAFALNRMSVGDFRHLPVTREGRLAGIVSLRDVIAFMSDWYPDLIPAAKS